MVTSMLSVSLIKEEKNASVKRLSQNRQRDIIFILCWELKKLIAREIRFYNCDIFRIGKITGTLDKF